MNRLLLAAAILIIFFISASCASTSKIVFPENMFIPGDFAGIVHAGGTRTQKEYDYLNYLGVSWTLHTFHWNSIEPEHGEWDFLLYDDLVDKIGAAGIKIVGILAYDNWRIHKDKDLHKYIPAQYVPDFLQYVKKTTEHFKGRVDAWCIWNEPNFISWNGTDEEFIELARQTADAVREVDSEVILLGGAFNRGFFGLPEKFIRKLFESGAMEKVDAVAFHPYELNPVRSALLFQQFKKIVDDYGFADKIWVTEAGHPTGGLYPTKVQEKNFPEYVIKTCVLLAYCGSKKILWYQLFDSIKRSSSSEDFFGLVRSRRDYTSKGAEAFRLCSKYLSGTNCYVQEPGRDGFPKQARAFWFKGEGKGALVLWNEGAGSKKINLKLPGFNHVMHDPVSGNEKEIKPETTVKAGKVPVFITWQYDLSGENQ